MTTSAMQMRGASPITLQEWKNMFHDFTTLQGSTLFIKKLIAVSLSGITYLRGIFPEEAYGEKRWCGIKLKILTEASGVESAEKFINLIRSCYEAIDKKYLLQINVGICTDPTKRDDVVEAYSINLRYNDEEFSISNKTSTTIFRKDDPTVQATFMLLKSIHGVTDILNPLPQPAYLTMKLLYNDEITPLNYEPPGFEPDENEKFLFSPHAVKLDLGKISTDFNGYRMFLKTALSKEPLSQILRQSQQSQDNVSGQQHQDDIINPSSKAIAIRSEFGEENPLLEQEPEEIECICLCKEDSGIDIIQCVACGKMQHSICYGFLKSAEMKCDFYCTHCIHEVPFTSSLEDDIYKFEENEQTKLGALRRALVFCGPLKHVTSFQIEKGLKCSKQHAKKIMDNLEAKLYIRRSGQKYIVNGSKIESHGFHTYFSRSENKDFANAENSTMVPFQEVTDVAEQQNVKGKSRYKVNDLLAGDENMDFAIEDEVEKLSLKSETPKRPKSARKRPSMRSMPSNDEDFQKPAKRRCKSSKETLKVKK